MTDEYKPGDRVRHRVFGDGIIITVKSGNFSDQIHIKFDRYGNREFAIGFMKKKIERIGDVKP